MAYWGRAMTYFQPLWPTRPTASDLERGWQAASRASEIGSASRRERTFIDAAVAFFDPSLGEYRDRIRHWADAMKAVHEAFPDDVETTAFFVLSHLAVAPVSTRDSHNAEAAALLETILRDQPEHPGAIHYTIHANDATGRT